jgi:hypothetical protein
LMLLSRCSWPLSFVLVLSQSPSLCVKYYLCHFAHFALCPRFSGRSQTPVTVPCTIPVFLPPGSVQYSCSTLPSTLVLRRGPATHPTLLPPTSRPSPSIACVATRPSLLDLIFQSILSVFSALLLCPIDLPLFLAFLILILSLVDRSLVVLLLLSFRFQQRCAYHLSRSTSLRFVFPLNIVKSLVS